MCIHFTCKYVCRKQRQNWSIPGEAEGEAQSRPFYMYWLNSPKFHTPVLLSFWKRLHIQPPPAPPASRGLPSRWKRHCSVGCFISYGGVKAAKSCLLMSIDNWKSPGPSCPAVPPLIPPGRWHEQCWECHPACHSIRIARLIACFALQSTGLQKQILNWEAELLIGQQLCPYPNLILTTQPPPPGAATATTICPLMLTNLAPDYQQGGCMCSGSGQFSSNRVSLPFSEQVHIWISPSKDDRTSGNEMFSLLSLSSMVWLPVTLIELEYKSQWM